MKRVAAIIVLCSLLFQCMIQLGIVGWYKLNKQYVSSVLCENKDKPQMHCNGKCYLKKQLKKTEEGQKNYPSSKHTSLELVSFILPLQGWEMKQRSFSFPIKHNPHYKLKAYSGLSTDIFHPPPVA